MIAILCEDGAAWREAGKLLRHRVRTADGPFRVWRGTLDGAPATVWRTNPSADEQYAAARLAVRRGAERLVHLGTARALAWDGELRFAEVRKVVDFRNLDHIQRLMPDLASELPVSWPMEAWNDSLCAETESDDSPVLASTAFPLTVRALALEIEARTGAELFDCSACGMLDAAREESVVARVAKLVDGGVAPSFSAEPAGAAQAVAVGRTWERILGEYLGRCGRETSIARRGEA